MAILALKNTKLFVDAFDLTGDTNEIHVSLKADALDATTFGSGGTHIKTGGLNLIGCEAHGFVNQGPAVAGIAIPGVPVVATGAAGLPNGSYRCSVTFVTAAGETSNGAEAIVAPANQQIAWSSIPLGAAGTTARRLYRTQAGGATGTGRLVTTINDNTSTVYTDNFSDAAIAATALVPAVNTTGTPQRVDDTLFAEIGLLDFPISLSPDGIEGNAAYFFQSMRRDYNIGAAIGALFAWHMNAEGRGTPFLRGTMMAARTSGVGTTQAPSAAGVQAGALSATQKLYAVIHVFDPVNGVSPTLDVTVVSAAASNFAGATTRATFTQKTARGSQYIVPVAGPITDTWWRLNVVVGGTGGPTFPWAGLIAIQ